MALGQLQLYPGLCKSPAHQQKDDLHRTTEHIKTTEPEYNIDNACRPALRAIKQVLCENANCHQLNSKCNVHQPPAMLTLQRSHGFTASTTTSRPIVYSCHSSSSAARHPVTTMFGLKRFIGRGLSSRLFRSSSSPCKPSNQRYLTILTLGLDNSAVELKVDNPTQILTPLDKQPDI